VKTTPGYTRQSGPVPIHQRQKLAGGPPRPFFPYYGSKWRIARLYAPPEGLVIEPFAGSAGYSVYNAVRHARLWDMDPIIVSVWDYLIRARQQEILALPLLQPGQLVSELAIPQETKWLIGFWANRGSATPKNTMTKFSARTEKSQLVWSQRAKERIARQQPLIREWTITHGSYEDAPDERATWFVDPPYVIKGKYYRHHSVNYAALAESVKARQGLVIACEHPSATYLPFVPLVSAKSTKGFANEAVYVFACDPAATDSGSTCPW
jgi:site-specific DNA-adenine methylase